MKVFYYGNGDTITPIIAALIHTEFLPRDRLPSFSEIGGKLKKYEMTEAGIPFYIGSDHEGSQIYCINLKNSGNLGLQTIEGVVGSETYGRWAFLKCPEPIHWLIPVGKIFVKMKRKNLGYTLIEKGIRNEYFRIVKFVR